LNESLNLRLADLIASIAEGVGRMAETQQLLKDCNATLRFGRALMQPRSSAKLKTAWQNMPVYLQQQIASLATANRCDDYLRPIVGDWPEESDAAPPKPKGPPPPMWD
jgi:hypothetical protein